MKFVLKGEDTGDIINNTLSNRKIENLELFLNPELAEETNPLELLNSTLGMALLFSHIKNGNKIVILVDSDADGFTSAAILYGYIKDIAPDVNIEFIVHDSKAHGLTNKVLEELKEMNADLLITPDSSSNDVEQIEKITDDGIHVLVLDHHHVSHFTEKAIIVNNQLCPVTNNNLVGAGVVYKFIKGIDEAYNFDYADKYLDLVAVGQVGDSSDIANPEIRKIVFKGIEKINNKFLDVALKNKFGLGYKIMPKNLSFSVIPIINAVARIGEIEERKLLFEALAGIDGDRKFNVTKKKKNKDTGKFDKIEFNMSLYEYAFDIATKVKSRQDSIVKKMIPKIEERIIDDKGIIIAYSPEDGHPGVTGLVANKLVGKYDKPVLLLNEHEDKFTGSGRGNEKVLSDFRKWCEDSELVEFAEGHDNAFGISIRKDKIDDFTNYASKIKKQEVIYEVDVLDNKPSKDDCEIVDKNIGLFGGVVSEPLVGLKELTVPKRFISTKGSMLNIYSWGVGIVQFNHNPKLYEEIVNYPEDNVKLNIVGTYSMNDWGYKKSPQMIVKDIEVVYDEEQEINEENIIF